MENVREAVKEKSRSSGLEANPAERQYADAEEDVLVFDTGPNGTC